MQTNNVLRAKQVGQKIGVSAATVWNWTKSDSKHYRPDFPRPFKIAENAVGWLEGEIDEYIGKLAANRDYARKNIRNNTSKG